MSWKHLTATIAVCLISSPAVVFCAEQPELQRGAEIYAQKCASCHGAEGEGTPDNYSEALFGDKSTIDLAEAIAKTMPEGEPELCAGDDAKAVALWMQSAFYSPEAQARINPPQRKASRLTVNQYRNAVADLAESFTWSNQPNEKAGLTGRYYKKRHFRDKEKAIERLDAGINFQFGEGTPDADKIPNNEEFSMSWEGSLVIDQTGWYDFTVKTENATRLFVNDPDEPIIDAWVKSGDTTEFNASLFLLAGRLYPIRLEWFTFKEKTASVGLWWTPPHSVSQPIPGRHLSPQHTHKVLVVSTPFPPDDRSDGYIRGTAVSREWHEATTYAAIEAVDKLTPMLRELAKLDKKDDEKKRREKLKKFCGEFLYRAIHRPVTDHERKLYVDRQFADGTTTDDAVRRSLLAILTSPRFLYRKVTKENDLYAKAEDLSFALLDTIPDRNLLEAAEKGWIKSEQGLRDQCWRIMNTYRGTVRIQESLRSWLNLERLENVNKDQEQFAGFTPELVADMRSSLELLLQEVARTEDGAFKKLLTEREIWMNDRLAKFYGVTAAANASQFQKVAFEQDHRAGIVSHPFLLAALAYSDTSSPIHRGVFVSRGILGRTMKPPPDAVSPIAPDLEPNLTTRERVAKQTSPAMCANCHNMINPIGFALEGFDAVGRLRETEKNKPIDASGSYRLRSGELAKFQGAKELAAFLSESPETHRSFVRQLFHHMVQQPILAYGPDTIDRLADSFAGHQFNIKKLIIEIAVMSATIESTPTASPKS